MIPSAESSCSIDNFVIFECCDIRHDTGLIVFKRKNKKSDNDENKFELQLYNEYTNQAIAMILDIKDLARMFESLEEYFSQSPNRGI